ncbi:hypothetical protein OH77DRAFT_1589525 [Trametes cingulata]|nr:hypothetical protein OH77DRAFT_1589525 [Trametes cingulata]
MAKQSAAGRQGRRQIISDDDKSPPDNTSASRADKDDAADSPRGQEATDNHPSHSNRLPRRTKEHADKAWEWLIPGKKKKRKQEERSEDELESENRPKSTKRQPTGSQGAQPAAAAEYPAPDIEYEDDDGDGVDILPAKARSQNVNGASEDDEAQPSLKDHHQLEYDEDDAEDWAGEEDAPDGEDEDEQPEIDDEDGDAAEEDDEDEEEEKDEGVLARQLEAERILHTPRRQRASWANDGTPSASGDDEYPEALSPMRSGKSGRTQPKSSAHASRSKAQAMPIEDLDSEAEGRRLHRLKKRQRSESSDAGDSGDGEDRRHAAVCVPTYLMQQQSDLTDEQPQPQVKKPNRSRTPLDAAHDNSSFSKRRRPEPWSGTSQAERRKPSTGQQHATTKAPASVKTKGAQADGKGKCEGARPAQGKVSAVKDRKATSVVKGNSGMPAGKARAHQSAPKGSTGRDPKGSRQPGLTKQKGSRRSDVQSEVPEWKDDSDADDHASNREHSPPLRHDIKRPKKLNKPERRSGDNPIATDGSHLPSDVNEDEDSGIELVEPSAKLALNQQHRRVRLVAKKSIDEVQDDVCLKNAFPDGADKYHLFTRPILLRAATALDFPDIARRIKNDATYARYLGSIPAQRISNFRGKVKRQTDSAVSMAYGLRPGNGIKVDWLCNKLTYIYPHDYKAQKVERNKPYRLPIFEDVMRGAWFSRPSAYGYKLIDRFSSSSPEAPRELEIPAPMLALAATAIYASIVDYSAEVYKVGVFSGNEFSDVYARNIRVLQAIKDADVAKYHALMHGFFRTLCGSHPSVLAVSKYADDLDVLDINGMPGA